MIKKVMALGLATAASLPPSVNAQSTAVTSLQTEEQATDVRLQRVPEMCLSRTEAFGVDIKGAEPFDQTNEILESAKIGMSFYEFNVCAGQNEKMTSILWTLADSLGQEVVYLSRAGPRLTGCESFSLAHRGAI